MTDSSQYDVMMKCKALKMKMARFCIESIAMQGHCSYGNAASIAFIGRDERIWHIRSAANELLSFMAASSAERKWLEDMPKQQPMTSICNGYWRATLQPGDDYAHCFDWLHSCAKCYGKLSLCTLSYASFAETRDFHSFFLPTDTPESIAIEWDLMGFDAI